MRCSDPVSAPHEQTHVIGVFCEIRRLEKGLNNYIIRLGTLPWLDKPVQRSALRIPKEDVRILLFSMQDFWILYCFWRMSHERCHEKEYCQVRSVGIVLESIQGPLVYGTVIWRVLSDLGQKLFFPCQKPYEHQRDNIFLWRTLPFPSCSHLIQDVRYIITSQILPKPEQVMPLNDQLLTVIAHWLIHLKKQKSECTWIFFHEDYFYGGSVRCDGYFTSILLFLVMFSINVK